MTAHLKRKKRKPLLSPKNRMLQISVIISTKWTTEYRSAIFFLDTVKVDFFMNVSWKKTLVNNSGDSHRSYYSLKLFFRKKFPKKKKKISQQILSRICWTEILLYTKVEVFCESFKRKPHKWSNTLKQIVGNLRPFCGVDA